MSYSKQDWVCWLLGLAVMPVAWLYLFGHAFVVWLLLPWILVKHGRLYTSRERIRRSAWRFCLGNPQPRNQSSRNLIYTEGELESCIMVTARNWIKRKFLQVVVWLMRLIGGPRP